MVSIPVPLFAATDRKPHYYHEFISGKGTPWGAYGLLLLPMPQRATLQEVTQVYIQVLLLLKLVALIHEPHRI